MLDHFFTDTFYFVRLLFFDSLALFYALKCLLDFESLQRIFLRVLNNFKWLFLLVFANLGECIFGWLSALVT